MSAHKMTIEEVENKLKILSHLVDDEFVKAIDEARRYLDELNKKTELKSIKEKYNMTDSDKAIQ